MLNFKNTESLVKRHINLYQLLHAFSSPLLRSITMKLRATLRYRIWNLNWESGHPILFHEITHMIADKLDSIQSCYYYELYL